MDASRGKSVLWTSLLLTLGSGFAHGQQVGGTAEGTQVAQAPAPAPTAPQPPRAPLPAPTPPTVAPSTTPPSAAAAAAAAVTEEPPALLPSTPGAGGLASSLGAAAPGTGAGSALDLIGGGAGLSPVVLGDMLPTLRFHVIRAAAAGVVIGPPPRPVPGVPPGAPPPPRSIVDRRKVVRGVVPSIQGFKVSENQSPRPQDRVFTSFNFYGDVNGQVNRQVGGVITAMRAYRTNFGFEKTFLDGNASLGMRFPIDTLSVNTGLRPIGGTKTAVGQLSIFGKYVLWQDSERKNLISTGMMVTTPTGPSSFAGSPASQGFRDTLIQPFVGFYWAQDRFYLQGFTAIEVPTERDDVTMYYNDVGMGYFLYRSDDPAAFLSAFVPTFEFHVNTPLNHRGALRNFDPAGTPDVVDLTYGANMYFNRRTVLSVGVATPVTGPRPFGYEFMALLNIYFGRTRSAGGPAISPPGFR